MIWKVKLCGQHGPISSLHLASHCQKSSDTPVTGRQELSTTSPDSCIFWAFSPAPISLLRSGDPGVQKGSSNWAATSYKAKIDPTHLVQASLVNSNNGTLKLETNASGLWM